jgi:ankyrin repeat protein
MPTNDAERITRFMSAVTGKNVGLAKSMLEDGSKPSLVNSGNAQWTTALHAAAYGDDVPMIELLLNAGASIDKTRPGRNRDMTKGEITALSIIQAENPGSMTPLLTALAYKSPKAAKCLIEAGANVNARSPEGKTPLSMATSVSDEICLMLIERGADALARTNALREPLIQVACYVFPTASSEVLLAMARTLTTEQKNEELIIACARGRTRLVKTLIEAGADPTTKSAGGHPLSALTNDEEILRTLRAAEISKNLNNAMSGDHEELGSRPSSMSSAGMTL